MYKQYWPCCLMLIVAACRPPQEMAEQPRYGPLAEQDQTRSGSSALWPPPGTVARGQPVLQALLPQGPIDRLPPGYPFQLSAADRARGKERYLIYCTPCHGVTGRADGEVVRRGFPKPADFMNPQLTGRPPAYFVEIATRGLGRMSSYAAQVPIRDRWLIAAYIKELQAVQANGERRLP